MCSVWPQAIGMQLRQTNQRWFGSCLHQHLHCIKKHGPLILSIRPVCGHNGGPNAEGDPKKQKKKKKEEML